MTTDYSKAYQLGQVDGASGKNRLAMRSFKRLLNISAYFPGFEGCDAEFFDGYKDGFRDGIRVQQVTTLQEATMPDRQGRGNSENRVEITNHRPTENWQAGGAGSVNTTKSALTNLQAQVQGSTHSTVSGSDFKKPKN